LKELETLVDWSSRGRSARALSAGGVLLVAIALCVTACGAVAPGAADRTASALPGVVAPDRPSAAATSRALSAAGIREGGTPDAHHPLTLPAGQLIEVSAAAAAGDGHLGADLDAVGTIPGDEAQAPGIPLSVIVLGWSRGGGSPAARAARAVLGSQDLTHPEAVVIPDAVLLLFAADAVGAIGGSATEPTAVRGPAPLTLAVMTSVPARTSVAADLSGPCSEVNGVVYAAINHVFDALHIPPGRVGKTGSDFLDHILQGITDLVVDGLNLVVEAGRALVVNGYRYAVDQLLGIVRDVATVAALVADLFEVVQPASLSASAAMPVTRKAVAPEVIRDQVTVDARIGGEGDWPVWFADCAAVSGVTLPPPGLAGSAVTWNVRSIDPTLLAIDPAAAPPTRLREVDASYADATVQLVTGEESADEARGAAVQGSAIVVAEIERADIERVRKLLVQVGIDYATRLLGPLTGIFRNWLLGLVTGAAESSSHAIAHLLRVSTWARIVVTYHQPKDKSSADPGSASAPAADTGDICRQLRSFADFAREWMNSADSDQRPWLDEAAKRYRAMELVAPVELLPTLRFLAAYSEATPEQAAGMPGYSGHAEELYRFAHDVCHVSISTTG
jgi:hypothetical protein